jgi:hypothetical protein
MRRLTLHGWVWEAYGVCLRWGSATAYDRDDPQFYELQENDAAMGVLLISIRSNLAVATSPVVT